MMQFINALSLAPDVNNWLANSRQPRILHVFDNTCNLINEHREVLSIVMPEIGNGPFNLVIPRLRTFDNLNLRSPVSTCTSQLIVGDLAINITNAKCWNPRPDWERLHAERELILNQLTQLQIANYCEASQWDQFSNPLISSLTTALVKRDIAGAKEITSKLAGLGSGLTPAGDDFMMGAIYAAWIIHPAEVARILAQEIANTAAPLTTSLSAAWLRSAGRGEAGILWHDLFNALLSSDSARVGAVMDKILAVGATSGADALAGFVGLFAAWMERAGTTHG